MDEKFQLILDSGLTISKRDSDALVYDIFVDGKGPLPQEAFNILVRDEFGTEPSLPAPTDSRPRVLTEGDSWINILWPLSSLLGHERTFFDVIEQRRVFATMDLAFPGDTFSDILNKEEYLSHLQSKNYDYFLFSGGGNDVLGGGALRKLLKDKSESGPVEKPESWFDMKFLDASFGHISKGYEKLARQTREKSGGRTRLLIHGYDYPIPRSGGPWLGDPLEDRGYHLTEDAVLIDQIFEYLINRLYETLAAVSEKHPGVELVDLRNTVRGRWNDELHPKTEASTDIADLFLSNMAHS